MIFPKLITLAAVLSSAIAIVWLQHHSVVGQQQSNSRIRAAITAIEGEIDGLERTPRDGPQGGPAGKLSTPSPVSNRFNAPANVSVSKAHSGDQIPYVTLSKANLKNLELTPFTDEFKLTDEASAVLGVSPSERAALNQLTAKLIATQQPMDVARVQLVGEHLTSEEGRKTTFTVPAYPEEGQKLAKALIAEAQDAIGADRTELLLGYADFGSLSADGYEPFGRTTKTITFLDRENPDGSRGDCKIFMKIVDTVSGFSLSTSFANRDDTIPKPWRHLIQNIAPAP